METPIKQFEMWARVDLFGHNQRVGKLSVVNTGVEVLYRLDIPRHDGGTTTEFYGKGAVYSILPVSEEAAKLIAQKLEPAAPISQWDLPEQWRNAIQAYKALPAQAAVAAERDDDRYDGENQEQDDDDDDDDDDDEYDDDG